MKTAEDFKRAIGTPDSAFEKSVLKTLSSLENRKTRRTYPMRRVMIAVTILLTLTIAAGAVAKKWDLGAFLRYYERNVGEKIAAPNFKAETWSNQWATVQVKELMHDGCMLYSVFEVVPKEKDTLLLFGTHDDLDWAWKTGEGEWSDETAAEYAQRTGADVVFVFMDEEAMIADRYICGELQDWRNENGVLTVYLAHVFDAKSPEIQLEFSCEMVKDTQKETKTLTASLPSGSARAYLYSDNSVYYNRYGVRLLETKITSTALGTLLYTRYVIEEPEKCRHFSPQFEFASDMNISRKFSTHSYEETDGSISQYSWWGPFEEIPQSVTLELLQMDAHEIVLKPMEKTENQG